MSTRAKTRERIPRPFDIVASRTVLLILDMISDFAFPDGREVLGAARRIAPRIAGLKLRAERARVPVIYVNDNLGRWRSDSHALLARSQRQNAPGREMVQQIAPSPQDFVVLKPRHSGFYATPLAGLIEGAQAERVILTGVSSHQCVLFTANDAHLRELKLFIPRDCVGAADAAQTRFALQYFRSVLGADIRPAHRIRLK